MVRLPGGLRGFLRTVRPLEPGARILAQVKGYAEPGKLVPVSDRVELSGRYTILTDARKGVSVSRKIRDSALDRRVREAAQSAAESIDELGVIVRSSAAFAGGSRIADEIRRLADDYRRASAADADECPCVVLAAPSVLDRAVAGCGTIDHGVDEAAGSFERHGISEMLDSFDTPSVALANGGNLVIEPTRALTAVDVNTGHDVSPKAGLKTNLAAARELPRQLRIRGIGGQIVVDFAPASKRERCRIQEDLETVFQSDCVPTALVGWTGLGHFEMHRRRGRLPLRCWMKKNEMSDLPA